MRTNFLIRITTAFICTVAIVPSAFAQQKTEKVCRDEWRANKAANRAAGKTEKIYVAECRGNAAATPNPAATPAIPPPPTAATARPTPERPTRTKPAPAATSAAPTAAGEFATEAQAKSSCPGDTVVWANTKSKVYHFNGSKDYGKTKAGAYMCEKNTAGAGMRAAKNEKHP